MGKEIVNRVANSDLITIDLTDYAPVLKILEIDLKQFLFKGFVLKEKDFRTCSRRVGRFLRYGKGIIRCVKKFLWTGR